MSVDGASLRAIADEYKLTVHGVSFWTPYWRDEIPTAKGEKPVRGLYSGKGSPVEVQEALEQHLHLASSPLETPGDYRRFMASIKLGVDCSGLVFHVLDAYLQDEGRSLADYLYKPRTALLRDFYNPAYTHPPHITEELLQSQPDQVALSKIQEFWGNQPVRLAGVRILTSEAACSIVSSAGEVQVGDQIVMGGRNTPVPHQVLVVDVDGDAVTYVQSGRLDENPADGVGGVEYDKITITNPDKPMNYQKWHSQQFFDEHVFDDDCVRRLKVLNEL